ncbi:hypothetical protein [Pseudomonas thivervalensis]|uniref:hypothetical protein n=1 Tax=Pseudomonas thivervalensis TaxID=86265 RepID=UPI003CEC8212
MTVVTITASRDGVEAKLKVDYSWSPSGNQFSVITQQYWAMNNDRSSGNIKVGLNSKGDTGWRELTGSGKQDGQWHDFVHPLTVEGNSSSAVIHFNWVYDVKGRPDINMTGQHTVRFP